MFEGKEIENMATDRHIDKVHASKEVPCINYDLLKHCITTPVSLDSQV